MDFSEHFGRFKSLWVEYEMLRPVTTDPSEILERREQDQVFSLLLTLNPSYKDVIQHILRSDKLQLDDVCAKLQKEHGSLSLFSSKKEKGKDLALANKVSYKPSEERKNLMCDHCKKKGHIREKCWILHPHLKPSKFKDSKANYSQEEEAAKGTSSSYKVEEASTSIVPFQDEYVKKSDLDALIKALKGSGKTSGISLNAEIAQNIVKPTIIDSRASHHMISNANMISNIKPALGNVIIANGSKVPVKGLGNLNLFGRESQALFMPNFTSNLVSVKRIATDLNCLVIFSPNEVWFQDISSGVVIGKGATKGDLYVLKELNSSPDLSEKLSIAFQSVISDLNNVLWHARLGHPNSKALSLMFPHVKFDKSFDCEACILGKHSHSVFPKSNVVYENCFDLVHSDVWSSPFASRENHKYFVTFIDEKSKYTWVTLLASKDRVLEAFKNFQSYVTNQYNARIKVFRSDNGGEYTSSAFKDHLANHGIIHQTSCPYTPQQNGVAERKNRHLMEITRAMMFHNNVPKRFWSDAVITACHLINRIPTQILDDLSPYQVLNKSKPYLNHLRVFGCVCYVMIPDNLRNKLEPKSVKAMFIGYSSTQKGYKCYVPETRRVMISRDVKFIEGTRFYEDKDWGSLRDLSESVSDRATNLKNLMKNLGIDLHEDSDAEEAPVQTIPEAKIHPHLDHEGETRTDETDSLSSHDEDEEHPVVHAQDGDEYETENETKPEPVQLRRSTRPKFPSQWTDGKVYYNNNSVAHPIQAVCSLASFPEEYQVFLGKLDANFVPETYEEAMEIKEWREAVGEENKAMVVNETWDEVDLPKGKKTVSSRYVFTIKYKSNGDLERYKARLVARGFTQTYGKDYLDTFAPVAKLPYCTGCILTSYESRVGLMAYGC